MKTLLMVDSSLGQARGHWRNACWRLPRQNRPDAGRVAAGRRTGGGDGAVSLLMPG